MLAPAQVMGAGESSEAGTSDGEGPPARSILAVNCSSTRPMVVDPYIMDLDEEEEEAAELDLVASMEERKRPHQPSRGRGDFPVSDSSYARCAMGVRIGEYVALRGLTLRDSADKILHQMSEDVHSIGRENVHCQCARVCRH